MLNFFKSTLPLAGFLLLSGCNRLTPSAPAPSAEPVATPGQMAASPPLAQATPTAATRISEKGIGAARLGMPFSELKQALGPEVEYKVQSPFMVDFDAIAVTRNGNTQFYILYLAGQSFSDRDVVQGLMTDNPAYKTDQGVGTGTTIRQAEAAYGKVTLSYNTSNESREYARFARQPAPNISFATGNGNTETAGIYPSSTGEFNETQQYRESATIQSVLVVCLAEACAQ